MKYPPTIAASVVILFGIAISLGIWSGLQASDDRVVREAVAVAAEHAQLEIEARIDARLDALGRLATLWTQFGPLDHDRWKFQAEMIHRDYPGFQAITWIDRNLLVTWIYPAAGNEAAQGLDITFEPRRKAAVETARNLRAPTVSRTVDLVQGGKGFLAYFPLYRNDELEGFIVGVFRVPDLLDEIVHGDAPTEFKLAIFEEGEQIFTGQDVENPNTRMAVSRSISLPGISWRLLVTPNDRLAQDYYRLLTTFSTASAAVFTLLVSILFYFAIAFWMQRREVLAANINLSGEIVRREDAELDLRKHLDDLGRVVDARTKEIGKVNVDLRKEIELHQQAKSGLEHNQTRLRHLTLDLSLSEERFRKRIAERIHDRVSNGLVLAKLRLGELGDESASPAIEDIKEILSATIEESRSMVFELSPPILFELGLANAVEWYANSTLTEHDLEFTLDLQDEFADLQPDLATAMYRAYTELCMNVIKHAGASHVHIELKEEGGRICIEVSDDGIGIEHGRELAAAASGGSYGLFSIRERLAGLGGAVSISESDLGGARVRICAPTQPPDDVSRY